MPSSLARGFVLFLTLVLSSLSATAQIPVPGSSEVVPAIKLEEMSQQDAMEHVATMTDEESRKMLLEQTRHVKPVSHHRFHDGRVLRILRHHVVAGALTAV